MRHTIAMLVAGLCCVALAESAEPIAVFIGGTGISGGVLAEMQQEVELSTRPAGILISWQSLDGPRPAIDFPDLVVIRMVGDCSATPGSSTPSKLPASQEQKTLGTTHTDGGQILPFGEVFCEPIRQVIGQSLLRGSQSERERLAGRAFGRVLSHELYHMLARTKNHGSHGIAKSTHSQRDLVASEFRFDPRDEQVMEGSR